MRPDADLVTPAALAAAAALLFTAEYNARCLHPSPDAPWLVARLERAGGCRWAPDVLHVGCDVQGYYIALDATGAGVNEALTGLLRDRVARVAQKEAA